MPQNGYLPGTRFDQNGNPIYLPQFDQGSPYYGQTPTIAAPPAPFDYDAAARAAMADVLGQGGGLPQYRAPTAEERANIDRSYQDTIAALQQTFAQRQAEETRRQDQQMGYTNAALAAAGGGLTDSFVLSGNTALNRIRGEAANAIASEQGARINEAGQARTNALEGLQNRIDTRAAQEAQAKQEQVKLVQSALKQRLDRQQVLDDNAKALAVANINAEGKLNLSSQKSVETLINQGKLNPANLNDLLLIQQYAKDTGKDATGVAAAAANAYQQFAANVEKTQAQGFQSTAAGQLSQVNAGITPELAANTGLRYGATTEQQSGAKDWIVLQKAKLAATTRNLDARTKKLVTSFTSPGASDGTADFNKATDEYTRSLDSIQANVASGKLNAEQALAYRARAWQLYTQKVGGVAVKYDKKSNPVEAAKKAIDIANSLERQRLGYNTPRPDSNQAMIDAITQAMSAR